MGLRPPGLVWRGARCGVGAARGVGGPARSDAGGLAPARPVPALDPARRLPWSPAPRLPWTRACLRAHAACCRACCMPAARCCTLWMRWRARAEEPLGIGGRGAWGRVGDLRWGMFRRGRVAHGSARLCVGLLGWLHVRLHAADCMPALAFVQVAAPARAAARPPPVRRSAKLGRSQQVAAAAGAAASRCQPAPRRPQGAGSSHARRDGRRW